MADDLYAPVKALRHLDIIEHTKAGDPARPAHLHLVPSDACNQNCAYCAYRDPTYTSSQKFLPEDGSRPRRMLPTAKVLEILDDCVALGIRAVQFTGGGEPTMHPEIGVMLAGCLDRGLEYAVVTNGTLVEHKGLVDLLARATWCRFSVDAADMVAYAKQRGVPELHCLAAWSAVAAVAAARDRLHTDCVVGTSCIVGPDNWKGLDALAVKAKASGSDNLSLAPQFTATGAALFDGCLDDVLKACESATKHSAPGFDVINRVPERIQEMQWGQPITPLCGYSFFTPFIGADANVYRCCVLSYNDLGLIGNISDKRFSELWMNDDRAADMIGFNATGCERCPYQAQNRTLQIAMQKEDVKHGNFV